MAANVVHGAWLAGVGRMLFLGSSCVYPRDCPQPIREEYLLSGPLEETNDAYAVAKIAGVKMCESYNRQYGTSYVSVMPANLYGPNDDYDLESCHVIPALLRKAHEAKVRGSREFVVWGTGRPRREFLHADDLADACVFLMEREDVGAGVYNVGAGKDITIGELAARIAAAVGYDGAIAFDPERPDGTPRKILDTGKLAALGWKPAIALADGLARAYADFRDRNHT